MPKKRDKNFIDPLSGREWFEYRPYFTGPQRGCIEECLALTKESFIKTHTKDAPEGKRAEAVRALEKEWSEDILAVFLADVGECCLWLRGVLTVKAADHQADLKDAVKAFRQSIKFLEKISDGRLYVPHFHPIKNADPFNFTRDILTRSILAQGALLKSSAALDALKVVEEIASKSILKNPRGVYYRAWVKFVRHVAFRYFFSFHVLPTESHQGPFRNLLETLRGIMGFEQKKDTDFSPRKAIANARAEIKRYMKNREIA